MAYKCTEFGFIVVPREVVQDNNMIRCYEGATALSHDTIDRLHAEQSQKLRERIAQFDGKFVVFTPEGDAEDFVLVGDDPKQLDREAYEHECEIRMIEPNYEEA